MAVVTAFLYVALPISFKRIAAMIGIGKRKSIFMKLMIKVFLNTTENWEELKRFLNHLKPTQGDFAIASIGLFPAKML